MVTRREALEFGITMARTYPTVPNEALVKICEKLSLESSRASSLRYDIRAGRRVKEELNARLDKLLTNLAKIEKLIKKEGEITHLTSKLVPELRDNHLPALVVRTKTRDIPVPAWSKV